MLVMDILIPNGKKILEGRKFYRGYYIPSKENLTYTLLYHIVYHKGYIDKKYNVFLKKLIN